MTVGGAPFKVSGPTARVPLSLISEEKPELKLEKKCKAQVLIAAPRHTCISADLNTTVHTRRCLRCMAYDCTFNSIFCQAAPDVPHEMMSSNRHQHTQPPAYTVCILSHHDRAQYTVDTRTLVAVLSIVYRYATPHERSTNWRLAKKNEAHALLAARKNSFQPSPCTP